MVREKKKQRNKGLERETKFVIDIEYYIKSK